MQIAAVIKAAGESARLGRMKQLVAFEGATLLEQAIGAAHEAGCDPVIVVVGARAEAVIAATRSQAVEFAPNERWKNGIGSSIRAGVAHVAQKHPSVAGVILMACDQPRVNAASLRRLVETQQARGKSIVASGYAGTLGVPALFLRERFPDLLKLADNEGAKGIIVSNPMDCAEVEMPEAAEDIDTPEQLARLIEPGTGGSSNA